MAYPGVIVVTGAAGNLGSAVCALLTARGCKVAGFYRGANRPHGASDRHVTLEVEAADLADPAVAAAAVAKTVAALGGIDGLVHTVGGFAMGSAAGEPDLFTRMWRLNVLTTVNMIRAVWPSLRASGGSIIAIGAAPALRAGSGMAAYGGAKAALLRLIEAAADEGRADRIRANAVIPSIIDTPQNRQAMPNADRSKWVSPGEIAEAIAFLLSDAASGISGTHLAVNRAG